MEIYLTTTDITGVRNVMEIFFNTRKTHKNKITFDGNRNIKFSYNHDKSNLRTTNKILNFDIEQVSCRSTDEIVNSSSSWLINKLSNIANVTLLNDNKTEIPIDEIIIQDEMRINFNIDNYNFLTNINNFYRYLEKEFYTIFDYIQCEKIGPNRNAYGIKNHILIFSSANLFEICTKRFCNYEYDYFNDRYFNSYFSDSRFIGLSQRLLSFLPTDEPIYPLCRLNNNGTNNKLNWWDSYNNLKHNLKHLKMATFENCINSLGSAGILTFEVSKLILPQTINERWDSGRHAKIIDSNLFSDIRTFKDFH